MVTLSQQATQRLMVFNALERGALQVADAAALLGRSVRQTQRLRAAYRKRGAAALVHGNQGRVSPARVPDALRQRLVRLVRTTYAGVNFQHLSELLKDQEGLVLSRPTLHRILGAAGIHSPRTRRPPRHRRRRERMPQAGMLIQCDGSHHAWLEHRGPTLVLHALIDDATSQVLAGWFDAQETAHGYVQVFRQLARGPGLPLAVYSDRHGIFTRSGHPRGTLAEQLQGQRASTQVGRMLHELGITWVPASSPQAKGRIERLFGALQDRLVVELRLAGIHDQHAANAFLPAFLARYNARFTHPPAQRHSAYRPWPTGLDPDTIFCFKYPRIVANDNTVTLEDRTLQILSDPHRTSYAKARVDVHERLDGTLIVLYQNRVLTTCPLPGSPSAPLTLRVRIGPRVRRTPSSGKSLPAPRIARGHGSKPKSTHPWREYIAPEKREALKQGRRRTFSLNR